MSVQTKAAAGAPEPYKPKMPGDWWLKRPTYVLYMIREFTSVFVALFCILHLVYFLFLGATRGDFESAYTSPFMIGLHCVILVFAIFHSVTWLGLTGVIQVVKVGGKPISPKAVSGAAIVAWLVVSGAVAAFFILRVQGGGA